jgi:hypothetical protein
MHQRGLHHPLHILAVKIIQELEEVGHFEFTSDDFFPFHEGVAITTVYGALLDAEEAGVFHVPEE